MMKVHIKKLLSLILIIAFTASNTIMAIASEDQTEILFKIGSETMKVNGKAYRIPKSYMEGNNTLVPLRAIVEAFGAEVNWKDNGEIELVYNKTNITMNIGQKACTVNGEDRELPVAPVLYKNTTMVPTRFIAENFGADVQYLSGSNSVKILVKDNAIKDFSQITGGINKTQIGNSYFGWSINVPKGSQVIRTSPSTHEVVIKNSQKGMTLEISAGTYYKKTLKDFYTETEKLLKEYYADKLLSASENQNYAEFIYESYYGTTLKRIYIKSNYFYEVTLTFDKVTAKKPFEDAANKGIISSFNLNFNGGSSEVIDVNKAKDGYIKYENSILHCSIDILPELATSVSTIDFNGMYGAPSFGLNKGESINIKVDKLANDTSIEKIADDNKALYDANYNAKNYSFVEKKKVDLPGNKSTFKLVYNIQIKTNKYIVEEYYFQDKDLVYTVAFKVFEDRHKELSGKFNRILESFKYSTDNREDIKSYLNDYYKTKDGLLDKVGVDNTPTTVRSEKYGWEVKVPGYWYQFSNNFEDGATTFLNPNTSSVAAVNTVKNDDSSDEEKFELDFDSGNMKLIDKKTIQWKGRNIRVYTISMNEDKEITLDYKLYVIDGKEYTYGFATMIYDLYSTENNLKELQDIFDSFVPKG
ncbi:MAG: copper amine oxidase N-terminal domain-containing protein [Clostridia bacterium]|nr:copper amine oxidase N-terminal domain-containing protein [Clostridia bacterium]